MGSVIPSCSGTAHARCDAGIVGLITIWYRGIAHLDRFASDLASVPYPAVRTAFVINSQGPEEVAVLRERCPRAVILDPGSNVGTAAAWNLGIRALLDMGCEFIGIWNVDVQPLGDCLGTMIDLLAKDPNIGACQPLLLDSEEREKVEMFGGALRVQYGSAAHNFRGLRDAERLPAVLEVDYLDGGTMLMPARVLGKVGEFDEAFFMYAEDSDLSIRIREAGYRLVAVRDARALHFHRKNWGDFPAPHQVYYETRNRFRIVRKHSGKAALAALAIRMILTLPRWEFYYLRRRKFALGSAYLAGVVDGVLGRSGKRGWVE